VENCLGKNCPNHCCSNKFKGLSSALRNEDDSKFVQIQLNDEEVKKIVERGRKDLVESIDGNYYLKLNEDFSCLALENGECSIYDARPDICKLYPYYFDPFCGFCIDKNCPGNFDLNIQQNDIYELLNNRINLYNKSQHFFFDGYDIDNNVLSNVTHINEFLNEINEKITFNKSKITLIPYFDGKNKQDGGISGIILEDNFHFTCHTFCYKNTMFIDCYGKNNCGKTLLNIINKYFNTENFDLCQNNGDKKGNFGKHIILKGVRPINYCEAQNLINVILEKVEMTPICEMQINYKDDCNFDILQPIAESHISIHRTGKNVVVDIFSCKFFDDKKIIELLNSNYEDVIQIPRGIYYK